MPKVPELEGQAIQTRPVQAPFGRNPTTRANERLGIGLRQSAKELLNVALVRQDKTNRANVNEAIADLHALSTGLKTGFDEATTKQAELEGTTGQRPEFSVTPLSEVRGKNAAGIAGKHRTAYDTALDRIIAGLGNDAQRDAFKQRAVIMQAKFHYDVESHEDQEIERASGIAYASRKERSLADAVESRSNMRHFGDETESMLIEMEARALEQGWDDDTLESEKAEYMSAAVEGAVMGNLADKRIETARVFYDSLEHFLEDGTSAKPDTLKALELAEHDSQIDILVSKGMIGAGLMRPNGDILVRPGKPVSGRQVEDVLEYIAGIEDRKLRGEVEKDLLAAIGQIDASAGRYANDAYDIHHRTVSDGASYESVPPADKAIMTTDQNASLRAIENQRLTRDSKGPRFTPHKITNTIESMPERDFAEYDFRFLEGRATDEDLERWRKRQRSARDILAGKSDPQQITRLRQKLNDGLDASGTTRKDDLIFRAERLSAGQDELEFRRQELGRALTPTEISDIVDNVLAETLLHSRGILTGFQTVRRPEFVSELEGDDFDMVVEPLAEIPAGHIEATREFLKLTDNNPNDIDVEKAYGLYKLGRNQGLESVIALHDSEAAVGTAEEIAEVRHLLTNRITAESDMTESDREQAYTDLEAMGLPVTFENMREAWINNILTPPVTADEINLIPEFYRSQALTAFEAGTGKPVFRRKKMRRQDANYWRLIRNGVSEDEALELTGIKRKPEPLLLNQIPEDAGAEGASDGE